MKVSLSDAWCNKTHQTVCVTVALTAALLQEPLEMFGWKSSRSVILSLGNRGMGFRIGCTLPVLARAYYMDVGFELIVFWVFLF